MDGPKLIHLDTSRMAWPHIERENDMTEYKYTKDDKKVVVIGKLNNSEYIVQEIFVSNGQEMPGGENFVASGLLDEPAKSWKQIEAEKWETKYMRLKASLERMQSQERFASAFTNAVAQKLASYSDVDAVDQLFAFLNNEIEYVVDGSTICTMQETITSKEYGRFDNLKLLTLFGDKRCGLQWQLNMYSDGSGGWGRKVYPARSLDGAKQYLEMKIKAKKEVNKSDIDAQEKYGLKYPSKGQLRKYHQSLIRHKKELVKDIEVKFLQAKKELGELQSSR